MSSSHEQPSEAVSDDSASPTYLTSLPIRNAGPQPNSTDTSDTPIPPTAQGNGISSRKPTLPLRPGQDGNGYVAGVTTTSGEPLFWRTNLPPLIGTSTKATLPHYSPTGDDDDDDDDYDTAELVKTVRSQKELRKRDYENVELAKKQLLEGDTLVFIDPPEQEETVWARNIDSIGPRLPSLRVRSRKLLDTGSKVFEKLLGPDKQFRILRRKGLVRHLPPGIKYVLDLTPPGEGDEAVSLTADLMCSPGVRMWYKSYDRLRVAPGLVLGREDTSGQASQTLEEVLETQTAEPSAIPGPYMPPAPNSSDFATITDFDRAVEQSKKQWEKDEERRIREWRESHGEAAVPEEYSAVRHRVGIERLLKMIEGRDVKLDSAVKVHTLFVLAVFFDCRRVVVDHILTWLLADPNCQFIEILPEATFKIGMGLECATLTRSAFSILVSEEALSRVCRSLGKTDANDAKYNRFGRLREEIGEDLRDLIENAATKFADRIHAAFESLIDERMSWFEDTTEYQKIMEFEQQLGMRGFDVITLGRQRANIARLVALLRNYVRSRILYQLGRDLGPRDAPTMTDHRRIERCMHTPSHKNPIAEVDFRRIYECLHPDERLLTTAFWRKLEVLSINDDTFFPNNIRDVLTPSSLLAQKYGVTAVIFDDILLAAHKLNEDSESVMPGPKHPRLADPTPRSDISALQGSSSDKDRAQALKNSQCAPRKVNFADAYRNARNYFDDASPYNRPLENLDKPAGAFCGKSEDAESVKTVDSTNIKKENASASYYSFASSLASSLKPYFPYLPKGQPASPKNFADGKDATAAWTAYENLAVKLPTRTDPPYDAPKGLGFNLSQFFGEVQNHIYHTACDMLNPGDMGFDIALTDTILCLGSDEFKFLPLWAGGLDDGTGGVFGDQIPATDLGPNGPGPSFHTGFSSASSTGTASDWDGRSESVHSSMGVENGFSDHRDRRRVYSDDGTMSSMSEGTMIYTPSVSSEGAFSNDEEDYVGKGKGVAGRAPVMTPSGGSVGTAQEGDLMSFDDDDDDETMTERGSSENGAEEEDGGSLRADPDSDEEMWDGGEEVDFPLSDDDEERMVLVDGV